jgi:predicted kinase
MKNKLIIMGGIPGSGKSYTANKIIEENAGNGIILSTDDFWYNSEGDYVFDFTKIGFAHKWNQKRAEAAFEKGVPLIIIDNTNTTHKERVPYIELGELYDYEIEFKQSESPWWTEIYENIKKGIILDSDVDIFVEKNTHGVPRDTIRNMMKRYSFPK